MNPTLTTADKLRNLSLARVALQEKFGPLLKMAFQVTPPPMDPAMMPPGAPPMPPGAPPMDPSMMPPGAPPMDPSMMPPGAPPMDPSMMPPGAPPAAPGGTDPQVMEIINQMAEGIDGIATALEQAMQKLDKLEQEVAAQRDSNTENRIRAEVASENTTPAPAVPAEIPSGAVGPIA